MKDEIKGEILVKDYLQHHLYRAKKIILPQLLITLILTFIAIFFEIFPLFYSILFVVIIPNILLFLIFIIARIIIRRNYKTSDSSFHERIIELNEKGIEYQTRRSLIDYQWTDIKKVVFLDELIILYVSADETFIIPSHFFSSPEQKEEWVAFIKRNVLV